MITLRAPKQSSRMPLWRICRRFAGLSAIAWLFTAGPAYPQGGSLFSGGITVLSATGRPIGNATVTICAFGATGIPCSPTITVYTSPALGLTAANPDVTDGNGNLFKYAAPGRYTYTVTGPGIIGTSYTATVAGSGGGDVLLSGSNAFTGLNTDSQLHAFNGGITTTTLTASGAINCTIVNVVRCISPSNPQGWAGSDLGAWLNDAQNNVTRGCLGSCQIQVASGTYTLSTATSIGGGVAVQFAAGVSVTQSAGITMAANSSMFGPPVAMAVNTTPLVQFKQGNTVNLAAMVTVNGNYVKISDIGLDGNLANNLTAGPNILVNNALRADLSGVTSGNSNSNGLRVFSTGTSNASGALKLFHFMAYQNKGSGVSCQGSADAYVSNSEFETNKLHGIDLSDCPTWRIEHNDFGANGQSGGNGLNVSCTFAGVQSNLEIIIGNQFGNQYQNDLVIAGYNTNPCAIGHIIADNSFIGSSLRTPANTYSELSLIDGGYSTISGNIFESSIAPNNEKYGLSFTESGSGRHQRETVSGNKQIPINGWGTAPYFDNTFLGVIGQDLPVSGSGLDLFDTGAGASTPHKFIRASGGNFQILNSAASQVMISIPDAAQLTAPAAIDTLVGRATTDTLANKTLNIPFPSGTGLQFFNTTTTCTTAATINTPCTTAAITLPVAEADTNYRVSCTGLGPAQFPQVQTVTKSNTTFTITLNNLTAAAASYTSFDCIVGHN